MALLLDWAVSACSTARPRCWRSRWRVRTPHVVFPQSRSVAFDADRARRPLGATTSNLALDLVVAPRLVGERSSGRWMVGHVLRQRRLGQFVRRAGHRMAINPLLLTINNLPRPSSSHGFARGGPAELRAWPCRELLMPWAAALRSFAWRRLAARLSTSSFQAKNIPRSVMCDHAVLGCCPQCC